ncbi:uncharacterized protein M421DRAFT_133129 [Didymella exigua CBS 183.55]|uniref:Stc1 domain-containing protein n=1 Tax=Didymella exigua CBS 183.55 TaxID=1150837 RepID=A0A6A5RP12_9PLEO|nr:uncharacterized protein M421DRAFT_133129 [Didymella exigua CBS 183.55]KAF1929173.1 hypothetical protein M421DRAFT_133129 [Didymella exigua CBS 183.55]
MVNRNRRQVHAYNPDEIERLKRVPLPPKLKCSMCEKNYNAANFGEKQKTDVRWQISRAGRITTNPKCSKCTGGQLVEIECTHCHKTKGLEDFAKVQRRKPDNAQCYACTDIQLARLPVNEERYDDPSKAFINTESSSGRMPEYWSSTNSARDTESSNGEWPDTEYSGRGRRRQDGGGINPSDQFQHAMSIGGEVSDTLIDSEFSYTPVNDTKPSAWSEVAGTKSWHTGTASSARKFNPDSYGRPSTRSISNSDYSFNSSIAERSQPGSDQIGNRSGFSRVKAYRPPTPPMLQEEHEFSSPENSDSGEEDNDSDDDTII